MSRAICVRCGHDKGAWAGVCPACGHRPEEEGMLVAWLLSDQHLDDSALDRAASRIRRGEPVRASDRMLATARAALGRDAQGDPGLSMAARLGLALLGVTVTALPGLTLGWWWREDRPRAARQALAVSVPAALIGWSLLAWRAIAPWAVG